MHVLAIGAWIALQSPPVTVPVGANRILVIDIASGAPVLEGRGPAQRFEYEADFSGTLHAWTESSEAVDAFLRVESASGERLAEDDDSGGGCTPYLELAVEAGERLHIAVALAQPGASGCLELHLVASTECEATREAVRATETELVRIRTLRESKEHSAALAAIEACIAGLAEVDGGAASELGARALRTAALEAHEQHAWIAARTAWTQVCAAFDRTRPPTHPERTAARQRLGQVCFSLGDAARARALFGEVELVRAGSLPADHPHLLAAQQNLAGTLFALGDLAGARDRFRAVIAAKERAVPADDLELARMRANLAATLHQLGDLEAARELSLGVLEVRTRKLPEGHPDLLSSRQNFAVLMRDLGDLLGSRALLERVLAQLSSVLPLDHPDVLGVRSSLAATLSLLGDSTGARVLFETDLAAREQALPEDHPLLARARGNLAAVLKELGELERARELEEQVLATFERVLPDDHVDLQTARSNLAATASMLGDHARARVLCELALAARQEQLPEDHPEQQAARLNLSVCLRAAGEVAEARALQEEVLSALSSVMPDDYRELQSARIDLAWSCLGSGGIARARTLAADLARAAQGTMRRSLGAYSPREVEARALALQSVTSAALSIALDTPADPATAELSAEVFTAIEMQRGASVSAARWTRAARAMPELEPLRRAVREGSNAIADRASRSTGELAEAVRERDGAERRLLAAMQASAAAQGVLAEPRSERLREELRDGEALVAFWTFRSTRIGRAPGDADEVVPHLAAFVVSAVSPLALLDLGPLEPIESAVDAWRNAVRAPAERGSAATPDPTAAARTAGDRLRQLAFDPLRPALGAARVIQVALDGPLHLVPLDALPLDAGSVGDTFSVRVHSSLWELLTPRSMAELPPALLAFGGIDYDVHGSAERPSAPDTAVGGSRGSAWSPGFAPLLETEQEVRGIGALFSRSFDASASLQVLTGAHATRQALLSLAPRSRFLHLATHGYFAPESIASASDEAPASARGSVGRLSRGDAVRGLSPMVLCGLAFAGANVPADAIGRQQGTLTAEELAAIDLSSCELAVLSACDSNVGVIRAGQGVASLQRALHMAGARTAITGLWRVRDEPTRELMVDFYRRLWIERKSPARSLWEAKARLRAMEDAQGRPRWSVRDWGAWVLTGESD